MKKMMLWTIPLGVLLFSLVLVKAEELDQPDFCAYESSERTMAVDLSTRNMSIVSAVGKARALARDLRDIPRLPNALPTVTEWDQDGSCGIQLDTIVLMIPPLGG